MSLASYVKRSLPAVIGGAVAIAALAAAPASASSGWWFNSNNAAKGYYNSGNGRVTACDVKSDGRAAVTEILTADGHLLTSVVDAQGSGTCAWKTPVLFEGRHKIRVCLQKGSARIQCGATHDFYAY